MEAGGLHHVTAIVSKASRSLDFYARVLGLRLVKRTVSHEDPGSYHLYFGDDLGRPGTVFSVFVWSGAAPDAGARRKQTPSSCVLRPDRSTGGGQDFEHTGVLVRIASLCA